MRNFFLRIVEDAIKSQIDSIGNKRHRVEDEEIECGANEYGAYPSKSIIWI